MKKNIFSKISVMVLLFCSIVVMSACSVFQKDGVSITGIDVIDETVPNYILAQEGEFNKAGIKIKVSYSDESYKDVTVTTEMIPEEYHDELLTPGEYDITILFKGHETTLHIKIAEVANVYTVRFFDAYNNLINVQEVKEGEDAVASNAGLYAVSGFTFMGWDRAITNVTEDMDVYATYINIENTLTEEVLEEKFFDAINYTMTTSHTSSEQYLEDGGYEELYCTNFHYDNETGKIEFQQKSYCAGEIMGYIDAQDGYASVLFYDDGDAYERSYCELTDEEAYHGAGIITPEGLEESFELADSVEYSYLIAGNKTTYYCTFIYRENQKAVYSYDDNGILSYKSYVRDYENGGMALAEQIDYVYSDIEVPFEDFSEIFTEDPVEMVNQAKLDVVQAYNNTIGSDFVAEYYYLGEDFSLKYDKDNKVSAEYNSQDALVNVKWEVSSVTNCYNGTTYSTVDEILSFIPNIAEIIETGKYNGEDIFFYVNKYFEEGLENYYILIEGKTFDLSVEIENEKIVTLDVYREYAEHGSHYQFTYENVELTLSDDIKNKVENAELSVNN